MLNTPDSIDPHTRYDGPDLNSLPSDIRERITPALKSLASCSFPKEVRLSVMNEAERPEGAQYFSEFHILAGGDLQHAYFISSTGEAFRLQINSKDVDVLLRVQDTLGIHIESVQTILRNAGIQAELRQSGDVIGLHAAIEDRNKAGDALLKAGFSVLEDDFYGNPIYSNSRFEVVFDLDQSDFE